MSEMVERVRVALATFEVAAGGSRTETAEWSVRGTDTGHATATGLTYDEAKKLCGRLNARAAILAMREPTEAMVSAGRKHCRDDQSNYGDAQATAIWKAMIDAGVTE
jgi:hypothetical protein